MENVTEKLVEIQKLLWKNDDLISQDDLFTLQDKISDLTLESAKEEGKVDLLVKEFPYIYKIN